MTIKTPFEAYGLPSLDHTVPPCYIRIALVFPVPKVSSGVEYLQRGAALLASEFPFVTGYVTPVRDPNARKGALQIEPIASSDDDHASILNVKHHSASCHSQSTVAEEQYLPLPFAPHPHKPAAIFRLQANAMSDGVILGAVFNHQAIDGTGAGALLRDFARCCMLAAEGTAPSAGTFEMDHELQMAGRALLSSKGLGASLPRPNIDHSAEFPVVAPLPADWETITSALEQAAESLRFQRFLLPAKGIETLTNACNDLLQRSYELSEDQPWVSKNDVVVSLLWMCFTRARRDTASATPGQNGTPSTSGICMAVNVRGRTAPPIPAAYVGNAFVMLRQNVSMDVILGDHAPSSGERCIQKHSSTVQTLSHMAYAIRRKLHSIDDTFVRSAISYLEGVSDLSAIAMGQSDFNISCLQDLSFCTTDYGGDLGVPADIRMPKGMIDGQFYVLPRKRHHGDGDAFWEVEATLCPESMERLCADGVLSSYSCRVPK
ncbi:hypothetical protein P168DRAFT_288653 [Aspergillus campestris IBT 28561]|uniref:Transferase family protein n=1 Tax=Aspergillus campestris (strain IBT 28561) TaxID=1392248 RepID=A0A2I1DA63_ASPC2|nr:uncharacterized protein P168DRAFT_288653 [Aspergillus campestris IBT 28561]PKY06746.1 hypothetical protein P168DRAFT_288653 [Aspergillus campestris IBT 28561]